MNEITIQERDLLNRSFARIIPVSFQASADFYDRLFLTAPALRSLFPDDLNTLHEKFMLTLAEVVELQGDEELFLTKARELGKRHEGYGARAAHYEMVEPILLETLAAHAKLTQPEAEVWGRMYRRLTDAMQGA